MARIFFFKFNGMQNNGWESILLLFVYNLYGKMLLPRSFDHYLDAGNRLKSGNFEKHVNIYFLNG
jgi:hypothetical protein